jgi:CRISPR/Cas system-associated endoribonuclease Cas2
MCYLTDVSYPVTKNQINQFLNSSVKSIRFYRTESNGKKDFIDIDIKKDNQRNIQNLIKCIL